MANIRKFLEVVVREMEFRQTTTSDVCGDNIIIRCSENSQGREADVQNQLGQLVVAGGVRVETSQNMQCDRHV